VKAPATRSSRAFALLALAWCACACGDPVAPEPVRDGVVGDAASDEGDGPLLHVDDLGFFVSAEPVEGEWYAGPGVRGVVSYERDGERHLAGRLAAGDPSLWTRDTDGSFVGVTPRVSAVSAPLTEAVSVAMKSTRRAAAAAGESDRPSFPGSFIFGLAVPAPVPPVSTPPVAKPAEKRDSGVPVGAPLLAWAPADSSAVRLRSVEAAFRFADLADRFAERIGFARGVARDYGALRLTLHHLLMPRIWGANPGGPKGVTECMLVFAHRQRLGALDVAVVLRIVDPELHEMETIAGVALETSENHLWRPDGDPFPARRVRRAVRAVLGDCEIVATSRELLERLAAGPHADAVTETGAQLAERFSLPPPRGARRAFSMRGPPPSTQTIDARDREARGLAELAERFSGLEQSNHMVRKGLGLGEFRTPPPWDGVVAACADTGVEGARIAVRLRDEESAALLADELRAPPLSSEATQALCRANLVDLVPLGMVEPRTSDAAERNFVWLGWRPVCPDGGTYRFHPVTGEPKCTIHGTVKRPKIGPGLGPSPVSEVAIDGSLLTFLLSIDWSRGR